MGSLVSLAVLLLPAFALRYLTQHDEEDGPSVLYPLSVFIGTGIWLVIWRYQTIRDRAVPFRHREPRPEQAEPTYQSRAIRNPSIVAHRADPDLLPPFQPTDRKFITCFDPATGVHIQTIMADNEHEIRTKISRAAVAQQTWKRTTFAQRRKFMRSLKKWLVDEQETCARVACRDTGKTLLDASLGEILSTCSKLDYLINHGERVLRPDSRYTNLMLAYKKARVHYEPLGVVAAIVSWNYPLHNAWSPIIAALFSGNAVVLKCSEHVVWSTNWFVGAIRECLRVSGHSEDLVQVVCCYPEEAAALTRSPMIKHITFIGSERVGRLVAQDALQNLTPVTLELGGKDPAIVLRHTDLNKWSSVWMRGVFQNAGQNCIGIERILVHTSQHDELYDLLVHRTKDLRLGPVMLDPAMLNSVDMGSMISTEPLQRLERLVSEAQQNGAIVEQDPSSTHPSGRSFRHPYHEHGAYFAPTVVGNVTREMEIANTELFAPIALLMPYETVDEAVEIANGTGYGLGASVFGYDQVDCIEVAKRLECGMVSINDFAVYYLNQDLPFGGTKMSGYGRFGGPEGLRSLTNPKAIIVDRFPWAIQTSIPNKLDYPIRSLTQSWTFVSGLVSLLYADTWRSRIAGLIKLFNNNQGLRPGERR